MPGPQKLNYFLIWAIWGSVRAYFPILSYYLGVPPGPLLAPIGSYWPLTQVVSLYVLFYSMQSKHSAFDHIS